MYVNCPYGPFGYCQTVSPSGALTTSTGLPRRPSTSAIEAPGGIDGVAQPTSASAASHEVQKRSGIFIVRLLQRGRDASAARVSELRGSARRAAAGAPVDRMVKLVDLVIGGLHQAARCVEEDRVDAVVADRNLIPVRPALLVEVAIGDDRDRRRPDEQPDIVLGHPRPDLGEVVERERLSEARDALIRAEPRHVRLLPEPAVRVLPDR